LNDKLFTPLGVGCAYDLQLPNFQFKFNHSQAMN